MAEQRGCRAAPSGRLPCRRATGAARTAIAPAMAVCRAAWITIVLELVTQCALVESQATNFAAGGRESYTQPASQGGVLTRTNEGPPYRDINDAVRSGRG